MQQVTQLDVPEKGVSIRIMDTIGSDYYTLGIYLLNDKDGNIMKVIENDYKFTKKILDEVFHLWIRGHRLMHGKKTNTWEMLVEGLEYAKLMVLADKIESVLQFCSEDNVECALGHKVYKYHESSVHGYGEYKCEAAIETVHPLQCFILMMIAPVILGAAIIIAAAFYYYRSKYII